MYGRLRRKLRESDASGGYRHQVHSVRGGHSMRMLLTQPVPSGNAARHGPTPLPSPRPGRWHRRHDVDDPMVVCGAGLHRPDSRVHFRIYSRCGYPGVSVDRYALWVPNSPSTAMTAASLDGGCQAWSSTMAVWLRYPSVRQLVAWHGLLACVRGRRISKPQIRRALIGSKNTPRPPTWYRIVITWWLSVPTYLGSPLIYYDTTPTTFDAVSGYYGDQQNWIAAHQRPPTPPCGDDRP